MIHKFVRLSDAVVRRGRCQWFMWAAFPKPPQRRMEAWRDRRKLAAERVVKLVTKLRGGVVVAAGGRQSDATEPGTSGKVMSPSSSPGWGFRANGNLPGRL
ncbi:hypothetical protein Arub01_30440 [Actinomadura rubrobrunea]|uniref:Uncharacterized protein n=1 Tax=Actinomadura rubrobrunea TaxID=115335 RepID=A0A9W6PVT9_9ACTN|nr:hypothetical protein Arub01_30440 [Actinomadura rubrobrunea]